MTHKRFFGTASAPLIILIVVLTLVLDVGAAGKYKTLHTFMGAQDGSQLYAGLIFDQAGNLYGTTQYGGVFDHGVVFELTPRAGKWTKTVLYNFTGGADGGYPFAGLIFDHVGNLYGTTSSGGNLCFTDLSCGVVFELTPNPDGSWTERVLHAFSGTDGWGPFGGLIFDRAGDLYGTAPNGGDYGYGVVFRVTLKPDGEWSEEVVHSFAGNDGGSPSAGVIFDARGNLFGTTMTGGSSLCACGTVFRMKPDPNGGWSEEVLHSFAGGSDGANPFAGLVLDARGNLYGTTVGGGDHGYGVVFQLTAKGNWKGKVLHQFTGGKDGGRPLAGLILDPAGNLYGTTYSGGARDYGVAFKLAKGGWQETVLHAFANHPGAFPRASLVLDEAGNLYGTTQGDGSTTFGSVFEITP